MSENSPEAQTPFAPARPQAGNFGQRWLKRLGCLLLFLVWLLVMLMPCAFVTLLVEKELTYNLSELPEHQWRLFLMDGKDERGFGLSRPSIESGGADEGAYCIATQINYFLWEGEGVDTRYCNCYQRIDGTWALVALSEPDGLCRPPE